ncbi:MAG: site-2 protease family protein [Oscillospiraceae bacterium]
MVIINILVALLIFGIIILVHEAGHFVTAKLCGVRVNEFAMGMGPAIFKKKRGETTYSLRAFPIGGYCAMEGEDTDSTDDRAFGKKSVPKRMAIILAGAFMNIVLGMVLIVIMTVINGPITSRTVSNFSENSSTQATGLQLGDEIVSINGMHIFTDMDINYQLTSDKDGVFDMTVLRNGEKVKLTGVTMIKEGDNLHLDFHVKPTPLTVGSVAKETVFRTVTYSRLVWISLRDLALGRYHLNDLSGPVGIVDVIGQVIDDQTANAPVDSSGKADIDWSALIATILQMSALITVNIGLFNLLPFPALDGGRFVFLAVEGVRGKPLKPEREGLVHLVGMAVLLTLMVAVAFNDIMRIIKR